MKGICSFSINRRVRLASISGLTFFVCLFACRRENSHQPIRILWKSEQATGIIIPAAYAVDIPDDSLASLITISIADQPNPVAIFGSFEQKEEGFLFMPMVPFTRGMHYDVHVGGKRAGGFKVPENNIGNEPALMAIYPSADTLPENLLKIYLHFDHPMREGVSGKFVKLIENQRDTIEGAFLDLQPELWNPDRTTLTLWLDPGRIKRDLQPNKRLGAPMQHGVHYHIAVSPAWTDNRGRPLVKSGGKAFVTTTKDTLAPRPSQWDLALPRSATGQPLQINFKESLDHGLLAEVFSVRDNRGEKVPGRWELGKFEKQCEFIPNAPWKSGTYRLLVETRLEDLAGNNLARPFDRDVTQKSRPAIGDIITLHFEIK